MLGDYQQTRLSEYARIYDILIPRDHIFRRMNEEIDFSFVRKELQDKYSVGMGRSAEDPVRMFKYLMLKAMHPASDEDLVKRAYTDMSYKFFLGLNPEDDVIDSSLLSKFRRQRLHYKPLDFLKRMAGQILKACEPFWGNDFSKDGLPTCDDQLDLEVMKDYCNSLVEFLENCGLAQIPAVENKVGLLKEGIEDMAHLSFVAKDKDARLGSKGPGRGFFGYKAHIGMTPESIVVAATVTSGEVGDGEYLVPLVEQAKQNGIEVESAIADAAYASKENLETFKGSIPVIAPVNPVITQGHRKGVDIGFHYNKDADTYTCPAGEFAKYKSYQKPKEKKTDSNGKIIQSYKNAQMVYFFDVEKCKECPLRDGCYNGTKSKSYTVTILSDTHKEQIEFEKTLEFKQKMKKRKRIEPLNAHLKNDLGMKQNISYGIESMTMQTAVAIYMSNIQKILKFEG